MPLIGTSTSASAKGYGMLASGYPVAGNPSFSNVSLLLHGDGTNGAQNNTFLDSSSSALTVTRSGNTTQGSFNPLGPNGWSGYFGGGAYITTLGNVAFNLTGDFTIEAWVYLTSYVGGLYNELVIWECRSTGSVGSNVYIGNSTSGFTGAVGLWDDGSTIQSANGVIPLNSWTHIAVVRSGSAANNVKIYVNGSQVIQGTNTTTIGDSTTVNYIGGSSYTQSFNNYISNLRILKGTALYTANFTPPTAPLTAITNTSLLTLQDNRFKDNSTNNFTLTATGSPQVQPVSPFVSGIDYSPATYGGSAYFDVGQYLITGTSTGLDLTNGVFTVECWVNKTATSSQNLFHFKGASGTSGISIWTNASNQLQIDNGVSGTVTFTTLSIPAGQWSHIAIVRNAAGTTTAYINGALAGSTTLFTPNASDRVVVAGFGATPSGTFAGYIANARIVKGTAVYTTAFTPPISLLTETTNGGATPSVNPGAGNCSLLLNFTNAGIFDSSAKNNLITAGSAQVSSAQVKFGTGSMLFNGTTDYLLSPSSASTSLGSGDFTIEFWVNPSSVASESVIVDLRSGSASVGPTIGFSAGGAMYFQTSGTSVITGSALATSAWYHVAVSRSSNNTRLFVNGVQYGSTYSTAYTPTNPARVCIGSRDNGTFGLYLNGYIDDLRITKGVAVYTQNFTPYPQAFPNS